MKEAYLSYIWRYRLYLNINLQTTRGEQIEVLHPGTLNNDAGPDFFNAKLKIGSILWAGNVELHQKSSDWTRHKHSQNQAYENVILHVVYEHDAEIHRSDGSLIPVLELKNIISQKVEQNFLYLFHNQAWIPCENRISEVDHFHIESFMDRLLVERLERKTAPILNQLKENQNDWENTFYQSLLQSFGLRVNKEPFQMLARELPLSVIRKHRNHLAQVEALFFGMAGFLEVDFEDEYFQKLKIEFDFLQRKFGLSPLSATNFKFSRLRPANFPSLRLAQVAKLIYTKEHLFSGIVNLKTIEDFYRFFQVNPSNYWENHYRFGKESKPQLKVIGKGTIHLIMINTVIPLLFLYGKTTQNTSLESRAIELLEQIPKEKNKIIAHWLNLEIPCKSAFQSQALLQLKNHYCDHKRCLDCNIGHQILKEA